VATEINPGPCPKRKTTHTKFKLGHQKRPYGGPNKRKKRCPKEGRKWSQGKKGRGVLTKRGGKQRTPPKENKNWPNLNMVQGDTIRKRTPPEGYNQVGGRIPKKKKQGPKKVKKIVCCGEIVPT